jgi:hypothetical protein
MKTRQLVAVAPVLFVLTLLLGACGGDDGGLDQVASLGDATDTGSGSDSDEGKALTEEERQQAHLDFAACMREHGVDMPDPEFTGDGGVMMRQGVNAGENGEPPDFEAMDAAHEACEHILEDVIDEREAQMDPEEQERMKQQALDFAKCMREHGIDMPDPQFDGGGRVTQRIEVEDGDPAKFEQAQEACAGEDGPGFRMGAAPAGGAEDDQ